LASEALSNPYCRSTCLSVSLCVSNFDAKYLGNWKQFRGSCPIWSL